MLLKREGTERVEEQLLIFGEQASHGAAVISSKAILRRSQVRMTHIVSVWKEMMHLLRDCRRFASILGPGTCCVVSL